MDKKNRNRISKTEYSRKRRLWQKYLSVFFVFVLVINTMFSGGLFGLLDNSTDLTVEAEDVVAYTPTKAADFFSGRTSYSFSNGVEGKKEFVDYCYHYSVNTGGTFCAEHKNDTLSLAFPDLEEEYQFMGLGNATVPFSGSVRFVAIEGMSNISLSRALFSHVCTDAKIADASGNTITLEITKNSTASSPLLADHVYPGNNGANWKIKIPSANSNAFAGVIGQLEENTIVVLEFENASAAAVSNTATSDTAVKDVGELCGVMKNGSSLTVTDNSSSRTAVSSANGNAGSLVGSMEGNASLSLSKCPAFSNVSVTSGNGYAGGLVGKSGTSATITGLTAPMATGLTSPLAIGGTVAGTDGAGGLYGYYANTASTFDLKDYNITAAVGADKCGGVFGVLENTASTLTIKNTSNTGTLNVKSGATANASGYFGGIVGKYTTNALTNSLIIDGMTLTAEAKAAYGAFGGAIGIVDSTAYVKTANTVTINAKGTAASSFFGGLVGLTGSDGVFVDLGNFTLKTNENFKGGGIVGQFGNGVLRLTGTTDMTNGKPKSAANCGQLVGSNDNVLVYAPGSGWVFKRSSGAETDDLGTWGEVVRGIGETTLDTDEVCFDSTAHTVTISSAVTSISSVKDFVRTALNIQLNQGSDYDCLLFKKNNSDAIDAANTRATLLASSSLSLNSDISLAGTGITGFMRDGGAVADIGSFTGTFDGNDHTITLAIGEKYGYNVSSSTSSEGVGQIYRHKHNGLFAVLAGTVKELTVNGTINVSNCVDGMNIGGIASRNGGNVTLTKVIANETVNYNESTNVSVTGEGKNIGGYIGYVGTNGTITINGVSSIGATFNLKGHHESWNVYGGAIGKITAETFTVNIGTKSDSTNKLTNGLTVSATDITTVASNGDGGGLIGHITNNGTSYSSRIVNVDNLEFSGCTIANAATDNGGGFLGYSWLNTTANINGLTVTSGTLDNRTTNGVAGGNGNIGVMCYSATGKWIVDSLTVTDMTLSNGGGTSVGMIVNKAFSGTDGLYLDVLNSGYTLTAATLPSLAKFDEIAAYSADDADTVLAGGRGVISINMNSTRDATGASIKTTGTYQNKLTGITCSQSSKYANSTARYYYNLDDMNSSDAGQNLVLWSVSKYGAENIKNEFISGVGSNTSFGTTFTTYNSSSKTYSDSALAGTANLAGLSFYPIAKADGCTIGNLTLSFDYSGLYTTAETVTNGDSYIRDPGANGADRNQHYLMHSGLFIDSSAGSTLTINGALNLSGTILELGTYKGALINNTMNGSLICTTGSITLNGITPKTTGNVAFTSSGGAVDGYLLINKIRRVNATVAIPVLKLYNVSTGTGYSSGVRVAKSLIGSAEGPGLNIEFSKIKLDGLKSSSIFSESTLLSSIKTNDEANNKLIYNYTYLEDWGNGSETPPRNVTYGYEVEHSVEYEDQENKYSSSKGENKYRWFTNPTNNTELSSAADFDDYLPYVKQAFTNNTPGEDGLYYRELMVNVEAAGLTKGCGTYNDPYIITKPAQLKSVASFIKNNEHATTLGDVTLPLVLPTSFTSGGHWCADKTSASHGEYTASGDSFTAPSGGAEWKRDDVRSWLCNAYYKISADIELDSFDGLGGASADTAFRGVIVGVNDSNDEPLYSITNKASNPIINVSNGCVVKDVNIVVDCNISRKQDKATYNEAYFGYAYDNTDTQTDTCKFYGGLIGEIMGGDNIIDNCYVAYGSSTITLSGSKGTIVPVGGYVGVIVFGGLIFKNMDARKTSLSYSNLNVVYSNDSTTTTTGINLASETKVVEGDKVKNQEAWAAIYVNPLVGRVINGYAVNETGGNALDEFGNAVEQFSNSEDGTYHDENGTTRTGATTNTLKNGKKHYSIADLQKYGTVSKTNSLYVEPTSGTGNDQNGKIELPNAQAMFVLSLITQSCAGTATDANGTAIIQHDETTETSRNEDEDGNVTINNTRTIIQTLPLSNYANSLSYGTNTNVIYGMSHDAEYGDVGTDAASANVSDYTALACMDTADNSAVPYIIRHYTVGGKTTNTTTSQPEEVSETKFRKETQTVTEEVTTYSATKFNGTTIPSGSKFLIRGTRKQMQYMTNERDVATTAYVNKRNCVLKSTLNYGAEAGITAEQNKIKNATEFYFEQHDTDTSKYCIYYLYKDSNNIERRKYLVITDVTQIGNLPLPDGATASANRGNLDLSDQQTYFTVTYNTSKNKWTIKDSNSKGIYYDGEDKNFCAWKHTADDGDYLEFYVKSVETNEVAHYVEVDVEYTETTITTTQTTTSSLSYPARSVTSTAGYYDIELTGNGAYMLPDSFRGLGSVGNYDSKLTNAGRDNNYCLKIDVFDGNNRTIDEDIYLNKFKFDNYFNVLHANTTQALNSSTAAINGNTNTANHGIGLFDTVIMKSTTSKISNFDLTGSVRTAIYSNDYATTNQECHEIAAEMLFLSVGGVCGWSTNIDSTGLGFEDINLKKLSVCGTNFIGGILGYSGLKSNTNSVRIKLCHADDISVKAMAGTTVGDNRQARCGMGSLVGKVQEGAVYIYGTSSEKNNTELTDYLEVKIRDYSFAKDSSNNELNYNMSAGGLVGFAGNGCQVYDMRASSLNATVTIGGNKIRFAGGMAGAMQSYDENDRSGVAVFKNCVVENINVSGNFAGGYYGGKWDSGWTTYSLTFDNCKMKGLESSHNTIYGNDLHGDDRDGNKVGSAGGLVGRLYPYSNKDEDGNLTYNVLIKDCVVSNYDITSATTATSYAGGFIGNASSATDSVTCYIHDSSVENCTLGAAGNYAGGIVGKIVQKDANQILGYNIKLDNIDSDSGNRMGAWIGYAPNDTAAKKTSIQLAGMAIYGQGFSKNVGNNATLGTASFVFADYNGFCRGSIPDGETDVVYPTAVSSFSDTDNVVMPKYPYVNINPQSSMGTDEIISGDGAVRNNFASSTVVYSDKTAASTMALKIYEDTYSTDTSSPNYSRRYTTFKTYNDTDAAKINGGYKIDHYMQQDVDDDGDRISNYYDEKGYTSPQTYDNFACVVIANNTTQETTDLINRYAQLVTNTSTDYAGTDADNDYFDIVVSPYILKNGTFVVDTSEEAAPGLSYSKSTGKFSLNGEKADSLSADDSFTLVDIQFKDPFDTDKIAYHLYIPVYTIKEIEITFSAAVMNGTNSVSYEASGAESTNPYGAKLSTENLDTHVDNLNTWYTTYIRYTYDRKDIEALLDSGNLNWSHNKYFYLDKTEHSATSMLPENTYMVLVDPNGDHDKKYQVLLNETDFVRENVTPTTGRITFDLSKFKVGNDSFSVSTFNELIAKKIKAEENIGGTGKYDFYPGTPSNTGVDRYVYTKGSDGTLTYYKYVGTGGGYDLSLLAGDICENYYISIYVPGTEDDGHLYGYYIRTPESFDAPSCENAITKSAKVNCVYKGAKSGSSTDNRQVYIGTLFEQETELSVRPNDLEIDAGNHTLNIYAKTTIRPRDANVSLILNSVDTEIYHAFNLYLDRKGEDGSILNKIYGLYNNADEIKAWYSIDTLIPTDEDAVMTDFNEVPRAQIALEDSYINVGTVNVGPTISQNGEVTVYSRIMLNFHGYVDEFPQKIANDTGVSVRAASNLAFDSSNLAFSSMSEPAEEPSATKHIYYRQSYESATLNYYGKTELDSYDEDGLPSENYSRLGVSGKYSMNKYMPVDTTAQYNTQNIENAMDDADELVLTLSLQKKTDIPANKPYTSIAYQNVSSIKDYWGAVRRDSSTNEVDPDSSTGAPVTVPNTTNLHIKCGSYDDVVTITEDSESFTLTIPKETSGIPGYTVDESGYIFVDIGFNAKTGEDFTEYANYKVNLNVKLRDSNDEDIIGSYADSYLIYTNAKVNHEFLKEN